MKKEDYHRMKNAKTADRGKGNVQNRQIISAYGSAAVRIGLFFIVLYALSSGPYLFSQARKTAKPSTLPGASRNSEIRPASTPVASLEELKGLQAVLETSMGDIVLQFYTDKAPKHAQYIAGLMKAGFYSGTTFHRVILRGIIQGGDPLSRDPGKRALFGSGGLKKLSPEFNDTPHKRGTVSAVLLPGNSNSAGSQFFICVSDQPQLDRQYTAWGYVVEGMDVVDKISAVPADSNQLAIQRIEIKKAFLRPIPPPVPIPFSDSSREEMKGFQVRLETSLGNIRIELFPDVAPETCRNFLKLAKVGLFDTTSWHRVVPGFVIQGGDLSTRTIVATVEAMSKYVKMLQPEFSDLKHLKGTISMARGETLDSASTSFFICLADQPTLNGKYTVFGKVVVGIEVVDKIASAALDGEKPKERIDLIRAVVVGNRD